MKFARTLATECVQEWAAKYVGYKQLKKLLKALRAATEAAHAVPSSPLRRPMRMSTREERGGGGSDDDTIAAPLAANAAEADPLLTAEVVLAVGRADVTSKVVRSRVPPLGLETASVEEAESAFFARLDADVAKVDHFFTEQLALHSGRLTAARRVCDGLHRTDAVKLERVSRLRLRSELVQLHLALGLLENFIILNVMAVRKILKKHDKVLLLLLLTTTVGVVATDRHRAAAGAPHAHRLFPPSPRPPNGLRTGATTTWRPQKGWRFSNANRWSTTCAPTCGTCSRTRSPTAISPRPVWP